MGLAIGDTLIVEGDLSGLKSCERSGDANSGKYLSVGLPQREASLPWGHSIHANDSLPQLIPFLLVVTLQILSIPKP